ncbi:hypothetical protein [Actinobaculum sp. 352]|uniref:hypothetical protein n=1 Tax=Actinobaculum sp. 352 TaxID=2490946 RepID=UPI000F7F46F1|nr:hypothetical protein [Actinobaculum sp. 352]RTE50669.1 hypothetical protein EKN07_00510 [Actinobaculum sp. 352]
MTGSLRRSLQAEAVKVSTLPSLWLAALATVALESIVAKALDGTNSGVSDAQVLHSATAYALIGIIVLAVLAATSEFAGHQVERSLLAVPRRTPFIATKMAVFSGGFLATALLASFAGVLALTPGELALWRTGLACAVFLTTMAMFCAGVAFFVRDVVAALAICLVGLLVLPLVLRSLPGSEWLPSELGQHLVDLALRTASSGPHPLAAAAALLAWVATAWVLGIARLLNGPLR